MKRTQRIVEYLEKIKANLKTDQLWTQYQNIFEPMMKTLGSDGAVSKAALFQLLNTVEQTPVAPRKKFIEVLHKKNFPTITDSNLSLTHQSIYVPYHGEPHSDRFFKSFQLESVLSNIHKELYTFLPKSSYQRNVVMLVGEDNEIITDAIADWQLDRISTGQSKKENLRDFKRGIKIKGKQFYGENDEPIRQAIDDLLSNAPADMKPALKRYMLTAADQGMDRFMTMEQLTVCRASIGEQAECVSSLVASGHINWYAKQEGEDCVICCDIEQTQHIIAANNQYYRLDPSSGHLAEISFDDMHAEKVSHPVSHSKATVELSIIHDGTTAVIVPKVVQYQQQYYSRDIMLADNNDKSIEHSSDYPIQLGEVFVHERLQPDLAPKPRF